ncbi:MAG: hypothetical protein IPL61_16585 [Myxococcales bacterium]|nr:hypothetical protein [Myxococcales bacterium]
MRNLRSLALFAAALSLTGCFSLFPIPGTGGKKSAPAKAEVDGKVFGTGTMVNDAWEVTLLVDPATVAVSATADQLIVDSTKGGGVDPINGDFLLTMRRKRPGETAKSLIAAELRNLNVHRKPEYFKGVLASFDLPALGEQTSNGSAIGTITAAEQGQCIFELILVAPDVDQLVKLELASRAGILAKVGKSPNPTVCR